jgi:hypothetical protein
VKQATVDIPSIRTNSSPQIFSILIHVDLTFAHESLFLVTMQGRMHKSYFGSSAVGLRKCVGKLVGHAVP